jgi:hypothetical protein
MPINPSKSHDVVGENKKILTEWTRFETTVLRLINTFNTILRAMSSVSNLRIVCLLPIYFRF